MLTSAGESPVHTAELRAATAAASVAERFGRRLFGLPGTHLGAIRNPREGAASPWHYWWQAHYLDALVDAALREADSPTDRRHTPSALAARRLLRSIWLRNGFRWTNSYYDDMAWLALAADRLRLLGVRSSAGVPRLKRALLSAATPDLGGGLYWNTARDFKNTPATGPAALLLARHAHTARARQLTDWLRKRLRDPRTGLFQDGIRVTAGREHVIADVYSYNQGPILAALLELGGERDLAEAAHLIYSIDRELATGGVLITHGGGDGGLFTGILVRYLALAALDRALPLEARQVAARLVAGTAERLWSGRRRAGNALTFPVGTDDAGDAPASTELSTQLQTWMILEAHYRMVADAPSEVTGGSATPAVTDAEDAPG